MVIREEQASDRKAIFALTKNAFDQQEEADLIEALRGSGDIAISMVAEEGGAIVGHALFTTLQAPDTCLALGPVSVTPDRQGRGIGSQIIREGLKRAASAGWRAVFVLGEPAYYGRFGFKRALAAKFETPYPKEYFMATELVPDALADEHGAVVYAAPFAAPD